MLIVGWTCLKFTVTVQRRCRGFGWTNGEYGFTGFNPFPQRLGKAPMAARPDKKNGSPRGAAVVDRATGGGRRRPLSFESSVGQEAVGHPDTGRQRTVGGDTQGIVLVVLEQLGPLVGQVLDKGF